MRVFALEWQQENARKLKVQCGHSYAMHAHRTNYSSFGIIASSLLALRNQILASSFNFWHISNGQWPMMDPNLSKGNDRIGLMKLYEYDFTLPLITFKDFPLSISLSTATATFGGRCARELF